jgi:hypothetical protein
VSGQFHPVRAFLSWLWFGFLRETATPRVK